MKKFFILALAVVGMLASCSKEEEKTIDSLVGVWFLKEIVSDGQKLDLDDINGIHSCLTLSRISFSPTDFGIVIEQGNDDITSCKEVFRQESQGIFSSEQGHFKVGYDTASYVLSGGKLIITTTGIPSLGTAKMTFEKSSF